MTDSIKVEHERVALNEYLEKTLPHIDRACRYLVYALNQLPGITTISSCSGHGSRQFYIEFILDTAEALRNLFELIDDDGYVNTELPWSFTIEPAAVPHDYSLRVNMYIDGGSWGESCADELADAIMTQEG